MMCSRRPVFSPGGWAPPSSGPSWRTWRPSRRSPSRRRQRPRARRRPRPRRARRHGTAQSRSRPGALASPPRGQGLVH
jgi:hypothetical protein